LPNFPVRIVSGARVSLLSKDKAGALWLTDTETMQPQLLARQPPDTLLKPDLVRAAFEDREGNVWFGTSLAGLFRIKKQFITTYSKPDGLTKNVYPIFEDRNEVVWIGTGQGLFKCRNGIIVQEKAAGEASISALAEDRSGRLLFGFDRVQRLEGAQSVPVFDGRPLIRVIYAIHADRDGSLWFGGQGGLVRLKDGNTTVYTTRDGLAGDEVRIIIEDGDGGIWIGAYGGLTHYKDGQFARWTEKDGLPSHTIRSLYQDSDGVLWIGTYDGGLARFKDGKFTRYNMKIGLYNDGVFQILEDGRRNFWISCNHGIYRVRKDDLNDFAEGRRATVPSIAYGKSDGMLNVECNGGRSPGGIKTRDGKLWFPTQDGVAVIDPEKVTVNLRPPPIVIESLLVDGVPVSFDGEVRIDPNKNNFEIQYTALSFINSENMKFKYRLEGLDAEWVDAGTRRTAYYTHVPAGAYAFRVIAANSDGVWNEEGTSIRFAVLPPFYLTWWFLALVGLCFFGLAYWGLRFRVSQVEKARQTQEEFSRKLLASQEQERQRIASELHDSLGQSLLIIKNRVALAQSDIDERETVEEQLTELAHSASSAIEECREIAYNLRPFQISQFGLSKTLYGIFMRINEVTDINATAEIDDIDALLTDDAQINVYRIVQECVNNIIKHSRATEALLVIKHTDGEITLSIEDNGRGFARKENTDNNSKIRGFGLLGIAERVRMLNGSYEIDSEAGRGTSVRIKLSSSPAKAVLD
jgi:signal transduction histidine kinase/streptogramin lyase